MWKLNLDNDQVQHLLPYINALIMSSMGLDSYKKSSISRLNHPVDMLDPIHCGKLEVYQLWCLVFSLSIYQIRLKANAEAV